MKSQAMFVICKMTSQIEHTFSYIQWHHKGLCLLKCGKYSKGSQTLKKKSKSEKRKRQKPNVSSLMLELWRGLFWYTSHVINLQLFNSAGPRRSRRLSNTRVKRSLTTASAPVVTQPLPQSLSLLHLTFSLSIRHTQSTYVSPLRP